MNWSKIYGVFTKLFLISSIVYATVGCFVNCVRDSVESTGAFEGILHWDELMAFLLLQSTFVRKV